MALTLVTAGTLGSVNVGLMAALGFLVPLGLQLDAMISLGLGPLEFDLAVQFSAALAAKATLSLQIGDPTVALQLALSAVAQLQAALQAALQLPPVSLSLSAELSATASLAATLSAKLGGIKLLIEAALAIKIPAMKLAADFMAQLSAGTVFLHTFDGDPLNATGAAIGAAFGAGLTYGTSTINPTDTVYGIMMTTSVPAINTSFHALFVPP